MGLFDHISFPHDCPKCHTELEDYQTKDLTDSMRTFRLNEPINLGDNRRNFEFRLYDYCSKCNMEIEAIGVVKELIFTEVIKLPRNIKS